MRPFTDKELKVVELRTNGIGPKAIARMLGISRGAVAHRLSSVYKKAGFNDVALLTRWAIQHALDEPVEPDTPETAPVKVAKKRGREKIKLGRIRRSKLV